ncbi:hypothetical protein GGI25_002880 [Coemansia spiralis]|uniref:Ketoreductase domain-containing protein n=2 Tax=Coemansia TaxID=4863 RepID=A0A9W8G981_9FUNG|nr:hypothetical protein BX070DRAFT_119358 [Coemansia spiralis]KAJ1992353.1 hypothetical protein EDC05_002851 [Coemansia umbellata]KAJ2622265.1 hypothetical protein GGI26_003418 [Coemansia sp. RSA 1358]KAJ2677782.1 hypothetical protein GGI25_002880 [Coemansia spiralis]
MADVVVVTGASKGIGRDVCMQLLAAHPSLVVVAVARSAGLLTALQQKDPLRLVPVAGDIAKESTVSQVIAAAKSRGRIRALVNNAASVSPTGRLFDVAPSEWHSVWMTNFMAPLRLIHGAVGDLERVVNVTSSTSQAPVPGFGPYGVTKSAINYLTAAMSIEYPEITAIAFYPGVVDTSMNCDALAAARAYTTRDMSAVVQKLEAPIPTDVPAAIIANLAMRADRALSGKYFGYSDPEMDPYSA